MLSSHHRPPQLGRVTGEEVALGCVGNDPGVIDEFSIELGLVPIGVAGEEAHLERDEFVGVLVEVDRSDPGADRVERPFRTGGIGDPQRDDRGQRNGAALEDHRRCRCVRRPSVKHFLGRQFARAAENDAKGSLFAVFQHEHDPRNAVGVGECRAGEEVPTTGGHTSSSRVTITCVTPPSNPAVVLSIAAHDPLGGAGLATDLTTFGALGVHGTVAVTAVTAQHLDRVDRVEPIAPDLVAQQIDAITDSFRIDAVKTGLLGSAEIVGLVADRVVSGVLPAPVVDPVLVDGQGNRFVGSDIERSYRERLLPLAAVVTPNLGEASLLAGRPLRSVDDVDGVAAAAPRSELERWWSPAGPANPEAIDVVVAVDGSCDRLVGPWVETRHVRSSGCTFAAAVAAELGRGEEATVAIAAAKTFVSQRLAASQWGALDQAGPISHWSVRPGP